VERGDAQLARLDLAEGVEGEGLVLLARELLELGDAQQLALEARVELGHHGLLHELMAEHGDEQHVGVERGRGALDQGNLHRDGMVPRP
jgi:hypothetical protein